MSARPPTSERYYATDQLATILPDEVRTLSAESTLHIFPLQPGTKIPYPGFRWLEEASADPEVLQNWWAREPFSNIGVPTGARNSIVVLDIDQKNGKDGLRAINLIFGTTPEGLSFEQWVALVPHIRTPNGGWHVILPYRPGIPSASFSDGVDIQADGRYVLWHPSWVQGAGFYRFVEPVEPTDDDDGWTR